jgi:2-polyprenyl-3-methyl-5-hydroxy-6-metoxy-1,4-benzoquinol methylase
MVDGLRWERAACPVCGSGDEDEFLRAPGDDGIVYRLAKCRGCAMVYQNPRPTEETVALLYTEDYPQYRAPERVRRGRLRVLRRKLFGRRERTLADRIPVAPGGRLLDYGCGAGAFAAQMRDRGWDASGMDFSPHAVATARAHYGLRAIEGTLPHPEVPAGSLDALTLRMVLEHVHDPARLLSAGFDALKPGGWLCVAVPNLAAWGFRAFGPAWFPLRLPWHLLHFTPDTLRRVVTGCGFVVETVATKGHTRWAGYSVDRARPRWWVSALRVRFLRSALTSWTEWRGAGDELCLLARKPAAATAGRSERKAA